MVEIEVEALLGPPVAARRIEIVERKGIGHPDTMCDAMAEAVSRALAHAYLSAAGRLLHYNVDKALLVAGVTTPDFGGGQVLEPMRFVLGDRATFEWEGERIPVTEIATGAVREWVRAHLRRVDPDRHLVIESALRAGSPQLVGLYGTELPGANDTSAGVGHAPRTPAERLVLAAEGFLNSDAFHARHPEAGEDVKVMGVRRGRRMELTVALAFVDRCISSEADYFEAKEAIRAELVLALEDLGAGLDELEVVLNALDEPGRGSDGTYLTVLGTSAEGADGGEVGRGNRVNGLITFHRPASLEAAAGKNPGRHVGKIYNVLARRVAERVHAAAAGVEEVGVTLCSRIGRPIDQPWLASAQLVLEPGVTLEDVVDDVRELFAAELGRTGELLDELVTGEVPVC